MNSELQHPVSPMTRSLVLRWLHPASRRKFGYDLIYLWLVERYAFNDIRWWETTTSSTIINKFNSICNRSRTRRSIFGARSGPITRLEQFQRRHKFWHTSKRIRTPLVRGKCGKKCWSLFYSTEDIILTYLHPILWVGEYAQRSSSTIQRKRQLHVCRREVSSLLADRGDTVSCKDAIELEKQLTAAWQHEAKEKGLKARRKDKCLTTPWWYTFHMSALAEWLLWYTSKS